MPVSKTEELVQKLRLCQQIARLVRARLPIAGQLGKTVGQTAEFSKLAQEVEQKLESGQSLAGALVRDDSYSSRVLAGCIRAGEQSDRLAATLDGWAESELAHLSNRRTLIANMVYPVLLIITAMVALFVLIGRLVPMYATIYQQFEQQVPVWLRPAIWAHEHPWLLAVILIVVIALPLLFFVVRRRGVDSHGLPRNPARKTRSFALTSRVAHHLLDAGQPLNRIVSLCCQSAGLTPEEAEQSAERLADLRTIPVLAPEASLMLNSVHSNVITVEEASRDLEQISALYADEANRRAAATARRLPMLVAVSVGITIALAYAGLVYAPWVELLKDIITVST